MQYAREEEHLTVQVDPGMRDGQVRPFQRQWHTACIADACTLDSPSAVLDLPPHCSNHLVLHKVLLSTESATF